MAIVHFDHAVVKCQSMLTSSALGETVDAPVLVVLGAVVSLVALARVPEEVVVLVP